jgi:hypothetical protein
MMTAATVRAARFQAVLPDVVGSVLNDIDFVFILAALSLMRPDAIWRPWDASPHWRDSKPAQAGDSAYSYGAWRRRTLRSGDRIRQVCSIYQSAASIRGASFFCLVGKICG